MPDSGRLVPGVQLVIEARWSARCRGDYEPEPYPCDLQPFKLDLECTGGPCELDGAGQHEGSATAFVTPTGPGRITISASIVHDGQTVSRTTELEVVPPERFTTMCYWSGPVIDPDCNETTLMADATPWVLVWPVVGDDRFLSTLLRINGREPASALGPGVVADLAQLYPAAAINGRVHPGTYDLDLELAGVTETHAITVR